MLPVIHLSYLKSIVLVLRLRAAAFLADGQSREAIQDVKVSLRLADSLRPEPFLISHLVRLSILEVSLGSVWEGSASHRWSEPELAELQQLLASIDLLTDYAQVLRGERAFSNSLMAGMRRAKRELNRLVPAGWLFQNQVCISRVYQLRVLPLIDAGQHRVYPEESNQLTNAPELRKTTPYNILARMLFPAIAKSAANTARAQTILDQAAVACAAERFRIAHGIYPEKLQALVPRFIEKIQTDVIAGRPLEYRRSDDGRFVLYSVGWNQKDDGGQIVPSKRTPRQNVDQGDWFGFGWAFSHSSLLTFFVW